MSRPLIVAVLVAFLVRELAIWLGYSWVTGTVVAILVMLGVFVVFYRRLRKR
jgi:hypothetical protein